MKIINMRIFIVALVVIQCQLLSNIAIAEVLSASVVEKSCNNTDTRDAIKNDKDKVYKLLYDNSKENNEKIVSTIQWSIGLVATFIFALLGSQIFFNYRVSKEEINSIRSDLDDNFSSLKLEVIKTINEDSKKHKEKISREFEKLEDNIERSTDIRFEEKDKLFDSKYEVLDKKYSALKDILEFKISILESELEKVTGHVWDLRGVKVNALRRFISTANSEIDIGITPEFTLGDIKTVLNKMTEIEKNEDLEKLLKKIPDEHKIIRDEIQDLYKKLQSD